MSDRGHPWRSRLKRGRTRCLLSSIATGEAPARPRASGGGSLLFVSHLDKKIKGGTWSGGGGLEPVPGSASSCHVVAPGDGDPLWEPLSSALTARHPSPILARDPPSPAFPLLPSQQLNLHRPQSLGWGVFISFSVHNLSELFTLPLPPLPKPCSPSRGAAAHPGRGFPSGPPPAEVNTTRLNPPSCRSSPESGVSPGLGELRVCGSLPLLKGTYRPISCYTIALDGRAMAPRALAQINRVWN